MRDYLSAPLIYDTKQNGWKYDDSGGLYELPGLWLTSNELQSLALLLQLLESVGEGLLADELDVVERYITKLLQARGISRNDFEHRIRILPLHKRFIPNSIFSTLSEALMKRQCLKIQYCSYEKQKTVRTISPQTLVYYRENWYIDAWCHLRNALRTFALSRIQAAYPSDTAYKSISTDRLKLHFTEGYGIFAGEAPHIARLRFLPEVALDISMQQWHPKQETEWDGDEYLLNVPYSQDKELIQDILRYTPHVIVEAPDSLRFAVEERLTAGIRLYRSTQQ